MPYLIHTPPTRTDPSDTTLIVDIEEILYELEQVIKDDGVVPHTVYLVDDYTEEEIEIDINQEVDYSDIIRIASLYNVEA